MATIGQHVSNIRSLINAYGRTDEGITDQFIYQLLKGQKNKYILDILLKFYNESQWEWKTYCMLLVKSKAHDCNCVPSGLDCMVLRSKYKIPQPIKNINRSFIAFTTIGGIPINLYSQDEWERLKDDDIIKDSLAGSIINGYLYIWNNLKLKLIQISGIWQDHMDWSTIPKCNEDGTETQDVCFDPLTSEFPLEVDKQNQLYLDVLSVLGIRYKIPQDLTNDSNEAIKT